MDDVNHSVASTYMESNTKLQLKTNYAVKQEWQPFYTGGCVDTSRDGDFLFCACGDKVQILDTTSGLVEKALSHDDDDIMCFKISPNDEFIVTATRSLLLKQWNWIEVKCLRTWKALHVSPVISMDFDPTSTLLATGGSDGTIKVWDLVQQYCTHNFKDVQGVVGIVRFHPTNLNLYTSSIDCLIKIWDLYSNRCIAQLEGHNSAVTSIEFASNRTLISGGKDNIVAIWEVPSHPSPTNLSPTDVIPIFHAVEGIVVLPTDNLPSKLSSELLPHDANFLFSTCGSEGILRFWRSDTKRNIFSSEVALTTLSSSPVYNYMKFLKKFNQILCVTNDQRLDFFNLENLKLEKHLVGYNDDILDIKVLGKDENYIVVASNSPNIKVFQLASSSCQVLHGHTDIVLCIDVFPNKVSFVSSSKDNSIRLWTLMPGSSVVECLRKIDGHTHSVSSIATCKINNSVFVSGSEDCTLKIWNIKKVKKEIVATVRCTTLAHQQMINSVTISPNDKLVATGSQDKTAKLWDIENGKEIKSFQGHKRGVWCVQFSPSDQVLATSSTDGTVKLWGLMDGSCLKTLEGHDASILKLIFITKGTQIVTAGSDGLLKLWTIKTSECVQTMDQHSDKVWALCPSKNDQILFTGSADSVIIAWEDISDKLREENAQAREDLMQHHQELQNLLQEKKFIQALLLAIRLNQPFTALNVIKELLWEDDGIELLEVSIATLKTDQKRTLFKFIVSWNSNSRNCHDAQAVLRALLLSTSPEEIETFPDAQTTIESLLPYTDRHFQRLSRIAQQATFLDYTWCVMKMTPMSIE